MVDNDKEIIESSEEFLEDQSTVDDDRDGTIDLSALTRKQLEDFAESYIRKIGEQVFVSRTKEVGTFENSLATFLYDDNDEEDRVLSFIEKNKLYKDPLFISILKNDENKIRIGNTTIYKPNKIYRGPIRGKRASVAFKSRMKGTIRRVPVLSSGINLLLRAPTINEIISLIERTSNEEIGYGRETGVQYFSFGDFAIKRQMIYFLMDLILDSSLKGWDEDNGSYLLNSIKITDLSALIQQVAAMEYPNGYKNFRLACYNEDCGELTEGLTVDLQKFIHHRFSAMHDDCVRHLEKTRTVSGEVEYKDLDGYSKKLGFDGETIDIDDYRYTFKVPSLNEYLTIGSRVVADIVADTQGSTPGSRMVSIASRNILTFLPWISKIEVLKFDDEDPSIEPEVTMEFSDSDTMHDILLDIAQDVEHEVKLQEAMYERMTKAQLSLVCYSPEPCPACGKTVPTESGMVTLDPISSFFTAAYWLVKQHFRRKMEALNRSE